MYIMMIVNAISSLILDSVATISVDQEAGTVAVADQPPTVQGLKLFSFIYVLYL